MKFRGTHVNTDGSVSEVVVSVCGEVDGFRWTTPGWEYEQVSDEGQCYPES